ncbi:hypothetical protein [Salininema proteolyticum]|uniref:Uncharacterized protein n=1 Tax=Salininema proteolyticum TaxID=1607685 RepID=A0ABV8TWB3_9ACTN
MSDEEEPYTFDPDQEQFDPDQAPQQFDNDSTFMGFTGSAGDYGMAAAGQIPAVGPVVKIGLKVGETRETWSRLFEGEVTVENVTQVMVDALDMVNSAAGLVGDVQNMIVAGADGIGYLSMFLKKVANLGFDIAKTCQPFMDSVGYVTGNPGRLKTAGEMWRSAAANIEQVEQSIGDAATGTIQPAWEGYTGTGAMTRTQDLLDLSAVTRAVATSLAVIVEAYADLSDRVINFVWKLIMDFTLNGFDAIKDVVTKGYFAAIPIIIDVCIMAVQYQVQIMTILLRVAEVFITGKMLTKQLGDAFADSADLVNLLTNASTGDGSNSR